MSNTDPPRSDLWAALEEFFDAYDRTHLVHDVAYENVNDAVAALRLARRAALAASAPDEGTRCTCMPFFSGHVTQHPDCPLGRREAAHPAASLVRPAAPVALDHEHEWEPTDD